MSRIGADKFRFVSPGIQTAEIDLSRRPRAAEDAGPCIIGRFAKGPTMRPTVIQNAEELVQVFGEPNTGQAGSDVSRYGDATAPSYAAYAALAYLRNSSNCTVVRLVGKEYYQVNPGYGEAGYSIGTGTDDEGGAFGLFLIPSASTLDSTSTQVTGTLAAVWYVADSGSVVLSGSMNKDAANFTTAGQGQSVLFPSIGANARFKASVLKNSAGAQIPTAGGIAATLVDAINTDTIAQGDVFTLQVPTAAGGDNVAYKFLFDTTTNVDNNAELTTFGITLTGGPTDQEVRDAVIAAINGVADAKVKYGNNNIGDGSFLADKPHGLTASAGTGIKKITLTMNTKGTAGNVPALTKGAQGFETSVLLKETAFSGGENEHYSSDDTIVFDFDPASDTFIRKVFNTNPTFTNSSVTDNTSANYKRYWLGPTFEDNVRRMFDQDNNLVISGSNDMGQAAGDVYGVIFPLKSSNKLNDFTFDAQPAKSGWVFGQDLGADPTLYSAAAMPKLFRFVTLEEAENVQKQIKISIANIKAPLDGIPGAEYGRFDVMIREIGDNDRDIRPIETFTGCNMNPESPNYIGKRIGDQRFVWSDTENRYRLFGGYQNASKYIRVEMNPEAEDGALDPALLPFGFYGVPRLKPFTLKGDATAQAGISGGDGSDGSHDGDIVDGVEKGWTDNSAAAQILMSSDATGHLHTNLTASMEFPSHALVRSASINWLADPTDRYFGLETLRMGTTSILDHSLHDVLGLKYRAKQMLADSWDASGVEEVSNYFTLDDIVPEEETGTGAIYIAGSRTADRSITAGSTDSGSAPSLTPGYQRVLDAGYDKFTLPLYGGFEGVDITEREPLINNRILSDQAGQTPSLKTLRNSYEYYTLRRAIDTVADAEVVDMNMLVMPGINDSALTDHMINTCEARSDALALIDVPFAYTPRAETTGSAEAVNSHGASGNTVSNLVTEFRNNRKINSSYACCYYPWVQARDTRNGVNIWMPPSVVALGAMSYSQSVKALWFAPAGFNRGGLSQGNAGIPVLQVSQRLSKKERDNLYENNINPIAQFPAEGIVIFGQKTMLQVPSALDRINVRRLLLFIKKRISRMAANVLFDPNQQVTWNRFLGEAKPFLEGIVAGFGLEDFRIKLDTTTTTADMIDRNIMYAQIYIKPTKAIEFIALDFIITNQGASFDD